MIAARRSAWIPWVFVAGMLVVVAVNGLLVAAALGSFTGVTTDGAYDRGRGYNRVLAEAARQDALGWQASVALAGGALRVTVVDRAGSPVPGVLEGGLLRPLEGTTLPLVLTPIAPGAWGAALAAKPGLWEARLRLSDAAGQRLDIRQRLVLP